MATKFYEKIKEFIKQNLLFISFCFLLPGVLLYPVPYYIYSGGGISDISNKITINNSYKSEGSFNLCYVQELEGTVTTYLLSHLFPSWDIVKQEDVSLSKQETTTDILNRDKVYLETTNMNAIKVAYEEANKEFNITDVYNYIIYISEAANTDLKIGDNIVSVNDKKINDISDLKEIVNSYNASDKLIIKVIRNKKEINCYAYINEINGNKQIGISFQRSYEYETNPKITFSFENNEGGPSGGLITALEIYNELIEEDITNGLKIAGTGTIDSEGNVGEIGGIKYKLKGAVQAKADLFLVPIGNNYEEAIQEKEKNKYKIEIIGIDNFKNAIKYLRNVK